MMIAAHSTRRITMEEPKWVGEPLGEAPYGTKNRVRSVAKWARGGGAVDACGCGH